MPKRLIQYALSRLDILDTEALGLDNLDIAWGKNTTLEFRDVGLRLKVLCIPTYRSYANLLFTEIGGLNLTPAVF